MLKEKINISLSNSFVDESFDLSACASYKLLLEIATNAIHIAVFDQNKKRFIALEKYTSPNKYPLATLADAIEQTITQSKLYSGKYEHVKCVIVNSASTLVPEAFYENGNEKTLLKFNVPLEWNDMVMKDDIINGTVKNIFAIPFELRIKLDTLFRTVSYSHFSSALIDSIIAENKNQVNAKLYLHIQAFNFETIYTKGKELILYNTFNYYTPEDFIFYTLFVCEQLHINTETTETIFIGDIEKKSELYTITQKYIKNIHFGKRIDDTDMMYQMQQIPKHNYYTLLNKYHL